MRPLPKWSNKTIERFLGIYSKHPCLFDFEDIQYAMKPARQAAMGSILQELAIPGLSILDLKRKIHSIRNAYTNECRKIERSRNTTTGTEQTYKPQSPWFYVADKILGPIVLSRRDRRASNDDLFSKVQAVANLRTLMNVKFATVASHSRRAKGRLLQIQGVPDGQNEEFDLTETLSEASSSTMESSNRSSAKSADRLAPVNLEIDFSETKSFGSPLYRQTTSTVAQIAVPENALFATPEVECKQEYPDFEYENPEVPYDEHNNFQNVEDELETFARSVLSQMRRLPEEYNVQLMADIQTLISKRRHEYLQTKNK